MTAINILMKQFKWLSVSEACWLLNIYGCQDQNVAVQRKKGQAPYFTSPREAYLDKRSYAQLGVIKTIRFFGGPPEQRRYYWGNWIMFVLDTILHARAVRGIGYEWLLKFNPGDPIHLRDQLKGTLRMSGSYLENKAGQRFESALACNLVAPGSEGSTPSPIQQVASTLPPGV